jgi:hypothetical protein
MTKENLTKFSNNLSGELKVSFCPSRQLLDTDGYPTGRD